MITTNVIFGDTVNPVGQTMGASRRNLNPDLYYEILLLFPRSWTKQLGGLTAIK